MAIRCREAGPADVPRVIELLAAQLGEHSVAPSPPVLAAAVARLIGEPALGRIFVAARDDAILGVAVVSWVFSLEHGGRGAWLDELYVVPAERGRGVGGALVDAVAAHAAAAGAVAIDLEVEAGHERALALYERRGFARHARQRAFRRLAPPREPPAAAPAPAGLDGGCLCGAIRYRIAAPAADVTHCHCTRCRRSTGAPFVTWITVPAPALAFTRGRPAERRSTPGAVRSFCAGCGTALTFREDARPRSVDVTAGSLDAPETLVPRDHVFTASRLPWIALDDALPRFPGANPAERDLP